MIEAAGGLVRRTSSSGDVTVLLVHRPRYDDWTFPKGKLDRGESARSAARREVHEETGLRCSLGAALPEVRYDDRKGRSKRVRYWAMDVLGGVFERNNEVDETAWLSPAEAAERLTYEHDRPLLAAFVELTRRERAKSA